MQLAKIVEDPPNSSMDESETRTTTTTAAEDMTSSIFPEISNHSINIVDKVNVTKSGASGIIINNVGKDTNLTNDHHQQQIEIYCNESEFCCVHTDDALKGIANKEIENEEIANNNNNNNSNLHEEHYTDIKKNANDIEQNTEDNGDEVCVKGASKVKEVNDVIYEKNIVTTESDEILTEIRKEEKGEEEEDEKQVLCEITNDIELVEETRTTARDSEAVRKDEDYSQDVKCINKIEKENNDSVKLESEGGGGGEEEECKTDSSIKEKKRRKIKIITKKSMLSNTTIIEVQSPKTCNKTREEKLEELIKALSKKSGDERIRQIMEFLQEQQTVSGKSFPSEVVEDIPRIRALTNIHGRLKDEELARDSLFEFQKKMCIAKKVKVGINTTATTSSVLPPKTNQDNKKKLIHLRAQELYVPERKINRLTRTKEVITKSLFTNALLRSKGRTGKYLEKRRNRLIQKANALEKSGGGHSGTVQQTKTATITMPKNASTIKKTLEKKSNSLTQNNNNTNDSTTTNEEKKKDTIVVVSNTPLSNNSTTESNRHNSKDRTTTSPVLRTNSSSNNKTNQKFYDFKENTDFTKNPVEDYARDKHKWLRHKSDSPKSSKNSLYCFDILDEITPNDVQPLKSEYPRRDNIMPEKIPHPCESFLGKLINRGNRRVLEVLLKVETPEVVCSTPNCITCKTAEKNNNNNDNDSDNNVVVKRTNKLLNNNKQSSSASSEKSCFSMDEAAIMIKNRKTHSFRINNNNNNNNNNNRLREKRESQQLKMGNLDFKFKNFLNGKEFTFTDDGSGGGGTIGKMKTAYSKQTTKSLKGSKPPRKIHSDRSRLLSQQRTNKGYNKKPFATKRMRSRSKEIKNGDVRNQQQITNNNKKHLSNLTKQEIDDKLKKYMVDPYLHFPTSVTIMPVSVIYQAFENTDGNPRMTSYSTTGVPFVKQSQQQKQRQREDGGGAGGGGGGGKMTNTNVSARSDLEEPSQSLEHNPSYIFTSLALPDDPLSTPKLLNKRQKKIFPETCKEKKKRSKQLLDHKYRKCTGSAAPDQQNNDTITKNGNKGIKKKKNFLLLVPEYYGNEEETSVSNTDEQARKQQQQLQKSTTTMTTTTSAAAPVPPKKILFKRNGIKSTPSKNQLKKKVNKNQENRPTMESVSKGSIVLPQKPPLKKLRDKNRSVHLKDDIQKVIQSVEFKMVDILSDPRKQNVNAFMDVENEITNVLAKFTTEEKTIDEEDVTKTSSHTNSSSDSKKEEKILTDICTLVKRKSPRKKDGIPVENGNTDQEAVEIKLEEKSKRKKIGFASVLPGGKKHQMRPLESPSTETIREPVIVPSLDLSTEQNHKTTPSRGDSSPPLPLSSPTVVKSQYNTTTTTKNNTCTSSRNDPLKKATNIISEGECKNYGSGDDKAESKESEQVEIEFLHTNLSSAIVSASTIDDSVADNNIDSIICDDVKKTESFLSKTEEEKVEEEKYLITAAYGPKLQMNKQIDLTFETMTKNDDDDDNNNNNSKEKEQSESVRRECYTNDTGASHQRGIFCKKTDVKDCTTTKDLGGQGESPNSGREEKKKGTEVAAAATVMELVEGSLITDGGNNHDDILHFLDNLSILTEEKLVFLTLRKLYVKRDIVHVSFVYHDAVIFFLTETYDRRHSSDYLWIDYERDRKRITETLCNLRKSNRILDDYYFDDVNDNDTHNFIICDNNKNKNESNENITTNSLSAVEKIENHNDDDDDDTKTTTHRHAYVLDLFYGFLFTLLYFGLTFNYTCLEVP